MTTFSLGIPSGVIQTPFGYATVVRFHENGTVDIYLGLGRTFTVASSTPWRQVGSSR